MSKSISFIFTLFSFLFLHNLPFYLTLPPFLPSYFLPSFLSYTQKFREFIPATSRGDSVSVGSKPGKHITVTNCYTKQKISEIFFRTYKQRKNSIWGNKSIL
uniref:Uncharacterized protein n=1 Tax=Cacopsylla melanoneura TaxID=428564 RepID=A0A8D8W0V8_9HEMI